MNSPAPPPAPIHLRAGSLVPWLILPLIYSRLLLQLTVIISALNISDFLTTSDIIAVMKSLMTFCTKTHLCCPGEEAPNYKLHANLKNLQNLNESASPEEVIKPFALRPQTLDCYRPANVKYGGKFVF